MAKTGGGRLTPAMKELVECYKAAQEKQGYQPRFRPSPTAERKESQPTLPEKSQPAKEESQKRDANSKRASQTVTLEEITSLYGTAPSTPPKGTQAAVVDLCSPAHKEDLCSPGSPTTTATTTTLTGYKHIHDISIRKVIRYHPGGRKEEGVMTAPKGAAFLVATFEDGSSMDANSCL